MTQATWRRVTFYAGVDSLSPAVPQYAGVQGDHNATALTFVLEQALCSENYLYRVQSIDGMGNFDTTDLLKIEDNSLTVPLTALWTQAGGVGEIRLVISRLSEDLSEEQVLYTLSGHLYYDANADNQPQRQELQRGLTSLIACTRQAESQALEAAARAQTVSAYVDTSLRGIRIATQEARTATAELLHKAAAHAFDGEDGRGLSILGLYGTLAELQSVLPVGQRGDAYAIGTAQANDVYVWNPAGSAWQNIGNVLGSWTMNDLSIDAGDWNNGVGGWMMDSLCMDAGDWDSGAGGVSVLSAHEINANAHTNLILDGNS